MWLSSLSSLVLIGLEKYAMSWIEWLCFITCSLFLPLLSSFPHTIKDRGIVFDQTPREDFQGSLTDHTSKLIWFPRDGHWLSDVDHTSKLIRFPRDGHLLSDVSSTCWPRKYFPRHYLLLTIGYPKLLVLSFLKTRGGARGTCPSWSLCGSSFGF